MILRSGGKVSREGEVEARRENNNCWARLLGRKVCCIQSAGREIKLELNKKIKKNKKKINLNWTKDKADADFKCITTTPPSIAFLPFASTLLSTVKSHLIRVRGMVLGWGVWWAEGFGKILERHFPSVGLCVLWAAEIEVICQEQVGEWG